MTPRNEIVAVDINDTSYKELSDLFTRTGRSKIIVYDGEIDNIAGYIHVSELFDPATKLAPENKNPWYSLPKHLLANKMMKASAQRKNAPSPSLSTNSAAWQAS